MAICCQVMTSSSHSQQDPNNFHPKGLLQHTVPGYRTGACLTSTQEVEMEVILWEWYRPSAQAVLLLP